MVVSDTSLLAYMAESYSFSHKQSIVYAFLRGFGPKTNSEIAKGLGWPINTVTPRVKELRTIGIVVDGGIRACGITGRNAHVWRVR